MSSVGLATPWSWRAGALRRVAAGLALLLILDLLWAFAVVGRSLSAAGNEFQGVRRAAATSDLGALQQALRDAAAAAGSARGALAGHPSLRVLERLGLRSELTIAATLAQTAEEAALIGTDLVATLRSLSERDALLADGRLLEDGLAELRATTASARARLAALDAALDDIHASRLGWLTARVEEVRGDLAGALELSERIDELLAVLPGLSGYEGSRRYLLVFQSPSEARGGGGLIGLYGILHADEGKVSLTHVGSTRRINEGLDHDVAAPHWFEELYGSLGAQRDVRLANLSPSFPAVARVLLGMHASATGGRLDGVIAMDPIALGKLTKATGPIEAPGWDASITAETARRVLLRDIYLHFGRWKSRAQNAYLERLVRRFWNKLLGGSTPAIGLAAAWADAAVTQHFKIYSRVPAEQRELADLGIAGDLRSFGPNLQMAFHNNFTGSKIDHFFRRKLSTVIRLEPGGAAVVETTVSMRNHSSADGSLLSSGRGVNDLPAGLNRMTFSMVVPATATVTEVLVDGEPVDGRRGRESGYPVTWMPVDIGPGREIDVTVRYSVPGFFTPGEPVEMTFHSQATVRPDRLKLLVVPPAGHVLEGLDRVSSDDGGTVGVRRLLKGPVTLTWAVTAH